MKKPILAIIVGTVLSAVTSYAGVSLSFDTTGSEIVFSGNNSFSITGGDTQWSVSTPSDASGSIGTFSFGQSPTWHYGNFTTVGSKTSADITPLIPTTFSIDDLNGGKLTGQLVWSKVYTDQGNGGLNSTLEVNVTGLQYSGSSWASADLQALADAGKAKLDFSFTAGQGGLQATTGWRSSYSASISAVPEPSTYLAGFSALGMLGMLGWRSRK